MNTHNDSYFQSVKFELRDVLVINGYMLLCWIIYLIIYMMTYVLSRQISRCDLLRHYRDIVIYALWGSVIYIGYRDRVKEVLFLSLKQRDLINNIYFAVALTCFLYFLKFGIVLLFGKDIVFGERETQIFLNPFWPLLIHSIVYISVAPIIEEIIFRGCFYPPLRQKFGAKLAIVTSSIIFSIWHLGAGLNGLIDIFIIGVLLAYVYEKTRSLIPPIIAHGIVNGSVVVAFIYKSFNARGVAILEPRQFNLLLAIIYFMIAGIFIFIPRNQQK